MRFKKTTKILEFSKKNKNKNFEYENAMTVWSFENPEVKYFFFLFFKRKMK